MVGEIDPERGIGSLFHVCVRVCQALSGVVAVIRREVRSCYSLKKGFYFKEGRCVCTCVGKQRTQGGP